MSTMFAVLILFQRQIINFLRLNRPQFSRFFQGATRWHTFIALAIIPIYFGQSALALGGHFVPTGSGAYALAKQMGGDAGLVASLLTLQVLCAAVTFPLVLGWLT